MCRLQTDDFYKKNVMYQYILTWFYSQFIRVRRYFQCFDRSGAVRPYIFHHPFHKRFDRYKKQSFCIKALLDL